MMTVSIRIACVLGLAAIGLAAGQRGSAQQPLAVDLLADANQFRAEREAELAIESALSAKVDIAFSETSLRDVARWLRARGVAAQLNERALEDFGIGADTPVSLEQNGVSLRSALRLMLNPLDLTWIIRDETLLITTPEESEARLRTVAYQVGDLLEFDATRLKFMTAHGLGDTYSRGYDFDALVGLISTTVAPDTWYDVGGPGTIEGVALRGVPLLVISQTDDIHRQVARLLANLRQATSQPGASRKLGQQHRLRRSALPSTQLGSPRQGTIATTGSATRHVVAAPNWFLPVDHD